MYNNIDEELYKKLKSFAYQESKPFCYSCYAVVEGSCCKKCQSDDNMRILPDDGPEYGVDWIIDRLVEENCSPYRNEDAEEALSSCYEKTVQIGWLKVNVIESIKLLDPISFEIARQEYIDGLLEDSELIEFGNSYYWIHDIEKMIENKLFIIN